MSGTPWWFANWVISSWIALPSGPVSANPPEITMKPFTPRSIASLKTGNVSPALRHSTARSMFFGMSKMDLCSSVPSIEPPFGFTPNTLPDVYPLMMRFRW
jgi:hypothetical protein